MNIWIELSTVAVEVFLTWYFFSGMLGKANSSTITKAVTGAVYAAALAVLSLYAPSSTLRSFIIIGLTYLAAKIYFDKKWISTFYPTVLFFLFSILSDILCGMLLQLSGISAEALMGDGVDRLIYNMLCKFLHLLCLYMILTITKAKVSPQSILKALPLLSCLILSIYICQKNFLMVMDGSGPAFLRLETLGILYINLIICAFVETLNRAHEREYEQKIARQQLELQKNNYLDIMERQEETRRLWHDIKKYMAAMEALVGSENKEEAQQCLDSIQSVFSGLTTAVDTGNKLIDSILGYGMKKAGELGVAVQPAVWVDSTINFPVPDLFVIIGNTLDNAMEACCQIEDEAARTISVQLHQKNHLLLYEISNPYNGKKFQKPGKIHGYGLRNVEACVNRNDGLMSITKENGIFTVSIQLNLGE